MFIFFRGWGGGGGEQASLIHHIVTHAVKKHTISSE